MGDVFRNNFSWSVSRDTCFIECPRQYYYRYYGYWGGWERDVEPQVRQLYVLKQLKNRATWVGQIVHDCIKRSLDNLSRGIPVLPTEEILSITRDGMRADFRDSLAGRYHANPKHMCGLFEHEYKRDVPDERWLEAAEQVDFCLRAFYEGETYAMLRELPKSDFLEIEQLSKIEVDSDTIIIKLDLAIRESDRVIIYDWKTGRRESQKSNLQMACYAYYAAEKYSVPIHAVITRRVELFRGSELEDSLGEKALTELMAYVRGSVKDMKALLDDPDQNLANEAAFARTTELNLCNRCNFLKVCRPEGLIPGR
jgi:hypothetical protein